MLNNENRWFEVWVDDSTEPPYMLLVRPNPKVYDKILVHDPKENNAIVYQASTYDAVKMWLLEDEYVLANGRVLLDRDDAT